MNFINSNTQSNPKKIGLAIWHNPRASLFARALAIVLTVSFIFPSLSWAFTSLTYPEPDMQGVVLGGPGSRQLALDYSVPGFAGMVTEAHAGTSGKTFVLIQDLHCNYEIQTNIREMLNRLVNRHPDIRLVAVEGASGIVPTAELSAISDSGAKRAVTEHFLRIGKLTGPDCAAICDLPKLELYGAEEAALYDRSLALIQQFATEENRGLILELQDQLEYLQSKHYNQGLAAFERRRKLFLRSEISYPEYLRNLVQDAKTIKVQILPPALRTAGRKTALDYHEQEMQKQYLEDVLRAHWLRSEEEKRLFGFQQFMEQVERIVNVSASREDLAVFQVQRRGLSVTAIAKALADSLGNMYLNLQGEMPGLEAAVEQALEFYRLADQRDFALYKNTHRRVQERNERQAVLVTGGYHTEAITRQLRNQGDAYVVLRPSLTQTQAASDYYDLLRNPNQASEFERLLVQSPTRPATIAVRNFVTNFYFRNLYRQHIVLTQAVEAVLRGQPAAKVPLQVQIERINDTSARVTFPNQTSYVVSINARNQLEFLPEQTWQERMRNQTSGLRQLAQELKVFFSTPQVQATSLIFLSLGLIVGVLNFVGVMALPAVMIIISGVFVFALWWGFSQADTAFPKLLSKRSIVSFSVLAGMLAIGPLLGEMLSAIVGATYTSFQVSLPQVSTFAWQGICTSVAAVLTLLPENVRNLAPQPHKAGSASQLVADIATNLKALSGHPLFDIPAWLLAYGGMVYHTRAADDAQLIAALEEQVIRRKIIDSEGIPYEEGELRPPDTHVAIFLDEHEKAVRKALKKLGLGNFESMLQFQYFKEPDGRKTLIAPIKAKRLEATIELIRSTAQARPANDPRRQELEEMLAGVLPKRGEQIATPGEEDSIIAPRVLVIDLLDKTYQIALVTLNDLNPSALQAEMENEGVWDMLLDELPADKRNHRATIKKFLDEALANSKKDQPEATAERLEAYVRDGAWHEISHALSVRLPKPMEIEFFNLAMSMPKGRLFFKNMVKGLHGMYKYRQAKLEEAKRLEALGDEDEAAEIRRAFSTANERTKNIAMCMFGSEMFADLFAMYLKEQAGETHIYGEYGEMLTPQMRKFFDRAMIHFQTLDAKKKMCVASTAELRQSRMYQAQKILAALGIVIDLAPVRALAKIKFPWNVTLARLFQRATAWLFLLPQKILGGRYAAMRTQKAVDNLVSELFGDEALVVEAGLEQGVVQLQPAMAMAMGVEREAETSTGDQTTTQEKPSEEVQPVAEETTQDFGDLFGERTAEEQPQQPASQETVEAQAGEVDDFSDLFGGETVVQTNMPNAEQPLIQTAEAAMGLMRPMEESTAETADTTEEQDFSDLFGGENLGASTRAFQSSEERKREELASAEDKDKKSALGVERSMESAPQNLGQQFAAAVSVGQAATTNVTNNIQAKSKDKAVVNPGQRMIRQQNQFDLDTSPAPVAGQVKSGRGSGGLFYAAGSGSLANALQLDSATQTGLNADQYVDTILQSALRASADLPSDGIIQIGFDDEGLQNEFNQRLGKIANASPAGAQFAGQIQTELFTIDGKIPRSARRPSATTGWSPTVGLAVFTNQISTEIPLTLLVGADGTVKVKDPVAAIPMSEAQQYLTGEGHAKFWAKHNQLLGQMENAPELKGFFLLSPGDMTADEYALFKNYEDAEGNLPTQIGVRNIRQTGLDLPIGSIMASLQDAFKAGARQVSVEFNLEAWKELQALAKQTDVEMLMFGSEGVIAATAGVPFENDISTAFLNSAFSQLRGSQSSVNMNLDEIKVEPRIGESLSERTQRLERLLPKAKAELRETLGVEAAEALTIQDLEDMSDSLYDVDQVVMVASRNRPLSSARPLHGRALELAASLFIGDPAYVDFKIGRMLNQPAIKTDAWKIELEPTMHAKAKGLNKIFSSILLGFVFGALMLDALVQVARTRDSKGHRIPLIRFFQHPSFVRAMQIMALIVMGRGNAMELLTDVVKQQVQDLQMLVVEVTKQGVDIDQLSPESIPASLKFTLRQFIKLKNWLLNNVLFKLLMRMVNVQDLIALYPEIYVLLNQGNALQSILWYFAPAATFERQAQSWAEGMDAQLQNSIARPVDEAQAELDQLQLQLTALLAAPAADPVQVQQLETQVQDRVFTLSLQKILRALDQNPTPRNVRGLMRVMIRELGRENVANADTYQEGIIKLLTIIDPFQAQSVQLRLASGRVVRTALPNSLVETTLRDQVMRMGVDVFNMDGEPLMPLRRKIMRTGAMA